MNHLNYIKALYKSLFVDNPPRQTFEAIFIDNCSTDGSSEFLKRNYPQVKIIKNDTLLGFGENNNKGAQDSRGEYVAIINPDIVLEPDSLDALYDYSEAHPNVGIAVPRLLNLDGTTQFSTRGFLTLKMFIGRALSCGNDESQNKTVRTYLMKDMDHDKTQNVPWAMGAAFLIKKNVWEALKGFDLDYFLYFEDEDICLRSWKLSKPVVYVVESRMIHNHLRGSKKLGKKMLLHFKSMHTFFKKHGYNIDTEKIMALGK